MQTLKIYGSGSASGNAIAQVIIPSKSKIRGVQFAVTFTSITAGATLNCEISRASAKEIQVNGAQQCIAEFSVSSNFVTSGLAQPVGTVFCPVNVDVIQGQIIYLHVTIGGTVTYSCTAVLHYE